MNKFIPLWCWSLTFLLVIIILFTSYLSVFLRSESEVDIISQTTEASLMSFWNTARLQNGSDNSVVAIGTSLVYHGFYFDELLNQRAENKNIKLQFLRFAKNSAAPVNFIWLLEAIEKSSNTPKVIFLQLEPFMIEKNVGNGNYLSALQNKLHQLIITLISALSTSDLSSGSGTLFGNKNINYSDSSLKNMSVSATLNDMKKADARKHRFSTEKLLPQLQEILDRLHDKGSKVIFIRMNYATQRYLYINPRNMNERVISWIKSFEMATGYPVWEFNSLDMAYYTDTAHLNANGRDVFTEWFLGKVQQEDIL